MPPAAIDASISFSVRALCVLMLLAMSAKVELLSLDCSRPALPFATWPTSPPLNCSSVVLPSLMPFAGSAVLSCTGAPGFAAPVEALTKLMGKGEAQARRELMELRGDDVEVDV